MNLIKNIYAKFLFVIMCLFFVSNNIRAKEITCKYEITNDSIPYTTLTFVYTNDRSPIDIGGVEYDAAKYIAYYQFNNGVKHGVREWTADKESTGLWSVKDHGYINFIPINTWINSGCLPYIDILFNDDRSTFGFSAASNAYQSKFDNMRNTIRNNLSYNSEKGQIYEVTVSANESTYWKVYRLYEGELIPKPSVEETGLPEMSPDGKKLCWMTRKARCWDFNTPIDSEVHLNAGYLDNNVNVGFLKTLQDSVNCAGAGSPYGFPYIVNRIIKILKIFTPIILILLGMVDFLRATISSDEKQMKDASSRFVRRILAAVIIFFVIAIVQFVFRLVGEEGEGALGCFNCFVNGDCTPVEETVENAGNVSSTQRGQSTSHESSSGRTHGGSGQSR